MKLKSTNYLEIFAVLEATVCCSTYDKEKKAKIMYNPSKLPSLYIPLGWGGGAEGSLYLNAFFVMWAYRIYRGFMAFKCVMLVPSNCIPNLLKVKPKEHKSCMSFFSNREQRTR